MRQKSFLFPILFILFCLCSACGSSNLTFESDDLVSVQHNNENNYMLLIYQDAEGQKRHVVRRNGVCEIVVTYIHEGDIRIKTRGKKERKVDASEAGRITDRINMMLQVRRRKGQVLGST